MTSVVFGYAIAWVLSQSFAFDDDRLAQAIAATFARRETMVPSELPAALTPAFAADEQKQKQWRAFVEDVAVDPGPLAPVREELTGFLMPQASRANEFGRS